MSRRAHRSGKSSDILFIDAAGRLPICTWQPPPMQNNHVEDEREPRPGTNGQVTGSRESADLYPPDFGELVQGELASQELNNSLYAVAVLRLVYVPCEGGREDNEKEMNGTVGERRRFIQCKQTSQQIQHA